MKFAGNTGPSQNMQGGQSPYANYLNQNFSPQHGNLTPFPNQGMRPQGSQGTMQPSGGMMRPQGGNLTPFPNQGMRPGTMQPGQATMPPSAGMGGGMMQPGMAGQGSLRDMIRQAGYSPGALRFGHPSGPGMSMNSPLAGNTGAYQSVAGMNQAMPGAGGPAASMGAQYPGNSPFNEQDISPEERYLQIMRILMGMG